MTQSKGRMVGLGTICFLTAMGCGLFRPSAEEAQTELARLINPALDVGLGGGERPEADVGGDSCHEPLVGPADGIRPLLVYTFSFSDLEDDPEVFLERVEEHWRNEGLDVNIDETDNSRRVYSGKDGYSIRAAIFYDRMEANIGGTGPCVDNPDPD